MSRACFTDYPIAELGDEPMHSAPMRPCTVLAYDSDKYVKIRVDEIETTIKRGYVYPKIDRRRKSQKGLTHDEVIRMLGSSDD